jgi:hypothetical protein
MCYWVAMRHQNWDLHKVLKILAPKVAHDNPRVGDYRDRPEKDPSAQSLDKYRVRRAKQFLELID